MKEKDLPNLRLADKCCYNCRHNTAEGWGGSAFCNLINGSIDEYMVCDLWEK